jgi:hypothetical protein
MTCQVADALIEDVLNGDADGEGENGLREHLRHCADCADAWHSAWQVRQALARCEVHDPGESYFRQATASIMARIGAFESATVATESPSGVVSARYGPLQVRGLGLALLMALGFLAPALRTAVADPVRAPGDSPAVRALEVDAAPPTAPQASPHRPAASHRPPPISRLRNALSLDQLLLPLCALVRPPCPPEPLPLAT